MAMVENSFLLGGRKTLEVCDLVREGSLCDAERKLAKNAAAVEKCMTEVAGFTCSTGTKAESEAQPRKGNGGHDCLRKTQTTFPCGDRRPWDMARSIRPLATKPRRDVTSINACM